MLELKAQLTVEYLASFITFIGLIIFIYFTYSGNIPGFVEEVKKEDVRSKAYQLSEILVNDPGDPTNWDQPASDIKRIGLSDEKSNKTNLISWDKVVELDNQCGNFDDIKRWLGLNKSFSILVFRINQATGQRITPPLCECRSPELVMTAINTTVRRITALNNSGTLELAEIIVQM